MGLEVRKVITILEECCLWYIFTAKTIRNANFEKSRSNIRILMLERVWPAGGQQAKDQEGQTTGVVHPRGM